MFTRKNDRFNIVIFSEHPNKKLGQIPGENELAQRLPGTSDDERSIILYGLSAPHIGM